MHRCCTPCRNGCGLGFLKVNFFLCVIRARWWVQPREGGDCEPRFWYWILRSPSRYAVGNNAKKVRRNFVMANYILNFSQVSLVLAPHAVIVLNRLYYLKVRVGCASAMPFLSSIGYSADRYQSTWDFPRTYHDRLCA